MKSSVSKSHQAWRLLTQSPCPLLAALTGLLWVLVLGLALPASAFAQDKGKRDMAMPAWPEAATPELALTKAVGQWIGAQQGTDPAGVRLAPLDPRLQIKACQSGLQLDWPFASQETVRVRCAAPTWQLFVRVMAPATTPTGNIAAVREDKTAPSRKVVVTTGLLQRGMRLSADQLSLVEWPASNLPVNALDRVEDAINAELVRDVPGGSPLRSHDIRPAVMVKRGQMVMLSTGPVSGLRVVARLEALQDGRLGEQIKLKNTESGRQVSAVVTGLNTADAL